LARPASTYQTIFQRWRDGQMALRWCAAGMIEAGKQFRRVSGHLHLPALRAALWSRPLTTLRRGLLPDPRHDVRRHDLGG